MVECSKILKFNSLENLASISAQDGPTKSGYMHFGKFKSLQGP